MLDDILELVAAKGMRITAVIESHGHAVPPSGRPNSNVGATRGKIAILLEAHSSLAPGLLEHLNDC
jgi:hypothetical protein